MRPFGSRFSLFRAEIAFFSVLIIKRVQVYRQQLQIARIAEGPRDCVIHFDTINLSVLTAFSSLSVSLFLALFVFLGQRIVLIAIKSS